MPFNMPEFPRHDNDLFKLAITAPFFDGGVFGAPWLGEGVWAIVWHKPFTPTWKWRILVDDRVVSQGESDDPELIRSEWQRAVEGGLCWPPEFRQFTLDKEAAR